MQYELELHMKDGRFRYINDLRGQRAEYHHFEIVSRDQPHTIAPNIQHAREVRDAYQAWSASYESAGLAVVGRVVMRPLRERDA